MPERATHQATKTTEPGSSKRGAEIQLKPQTPTAETIGWLLSADDSRQSGDDDGSDKPASKEGARRRGPSSGQVLALQRTVGNRATTDILRSIVQRVAVSSTYNETLYNQTNPTTGEASAASYGGTAAWDITRQGDTGATVTVKIRFLNQARNTVPPPNPNPTNLPRLGQLIGTPTEIPASDPRRGWATGMCQQAISHWNGKLTLVGEETNVFSANTTKRLPVTFRAVPVFGLAEEANQQVIVHGPATTAGAAGHPIDAGNWYMNKNNNVYPANDNIIYAHEYGHLIGIPDEYSQSNQQMNALLHQAAPGGAASAMAALDRATIERMALRAMRQPLVDQLSAAMPLITQSITAQGDLVKQKMAAAARGGVRNPAVAEHLRARLVAESDPKLGPQVPRVVAFQTTRNFSNITRASEGVEAAFNPAALGRQIGNMYAQALDAPLGQNVTIAGLGEVSINVPGSRYHAPTNTMIPGSVARTTAAGGYNAGNASAAATQAVGPSAPAPGATGPGGAALLPPIPPPDSLAGQITALPAAWGAAGSALESGVTADAFATKLQAILPTAAAALAADVMALLGGPPAPAKMEKTRALYERAYALINQAATTAAQQLAVDLINSQVQPVIQASVTSLQTTIANEAKNASTMSPAQLAAAPNPTPAMRAIVGDMKRRLDIDKARTAGGGRDPLGGGGSAADQDVTYSYQGLMGSNATAAVRADQFAPVVNSFNQHHKGFWEKKFKAETK